MLCIVDLQHSGQLSYEAAGLKSHWSVGSVLKKKVCTQGGRVQ